MFRSKLKKNYKWIMSILIILGVALILIARLEMDWLNNEYTSGLGFGFILAAALNLIVLRFKFKNQDDEAFEMEMNDERVKLNRMKAFAYAGIVTIVLLCISSMLHAFIDFDIMIGVIITLISYSVSVAFFKFYLRNR